MTYNPDWGTGGGGITELTGDVTAAGTGSVAATVAADAVTNAKLADMAAGTIKGNNTGGAANPLDLTASQAKALLAIAAADVSGLGTLATQSGTFSGTSSGTNTGDQTSVSGNAGTATALATGRTIAMTGDVAWTSPSFDGTGNVTAAGTIAADAVTYAKMQNVSALSKLLGRGDSGAGDVQEITLGTNLTMSGTTLNAASGGSVTIGSASLAFTDGDTARRTTIADASVTATSKILLSITRPTVTDVNDVGLMYTANVVSRGAGTFDVFTICTDIGGDDPVLAPPNETITLHYTVAA